MKPHLRFKHHVWSCASVSSEGRAFIGFGYSVRAAWDEWQREVDQQHIDPRFAAAHYGHDLFPACRPSSPTRT